MSRPLARHSAAAGALLFSILGTSGCTQSATATALRALGSSGPTAFVCLDAPNDDLAAMARPLEQCSRTRTETTDDYTVAHLYALVTQPHSAQVAVIDLTTNSGAVLDADPTVPGADFLPVGALPTAIVAAPGGTATFVATAEPRYEGIYALPSDQIRGGSPRLSSWPACRLPAAPGQMLIAVDGVDDDGLSRPSCEAARGASDDSASCEGKTHCHGDLSADTESAGQPGRTKLVVSLPSEGGIAIIDAQAILDQEAGAFEPCRIERWLPLDVELPPAPDAPPDPPAGQDGCVEPPASVGPFAAAYQATPAGMAFDGNRLYVADDGAPVVHRIDMPSPCEPVEVPPLVASSLEDPDRVVLTRRISVSPLTLDLKRYLYAIDEIDGSVMVYDVSDGSTSTRPIERPQANTNPFQPADRIRYQAPPRDIVLLQYQSDSIDDQTGATVPLRCDPDPTSEGPGTIYRTSSAYDSGASPFKLRGVFAFALLASGDIVTIDVDDYDAACRGPRDESPLFGCGSDPPASGLERSGEYSCNTVTPHQTRAGSYLLTKDGVAAAQPGVTDFPLLVDPDGSLIQPDSPEGEAAPVMRATTPVAETPALTLAVGDRIEELDPATGQWLDDAVPNPSEHTLAMNLADPRAHILDQSWTVTYEGALPGFDDRFAQLVTDGAGYQLTEPTSHFCARGVMSETAFTEQLTAAGQDPAAASGLADYVQLVSDSPVEGDSYWSQQTSCGFKACKQTYGTSTQPRVGRDLRIVEATPNTLDLVARHGADDSATPLACCFPYVVEFRVRAGEQWAVIGDGVGFLHHVTIDDRGVCRPSCTPDEQLLNGRVRQAPSDTVVADDDAFAFSNPMFRFAISGEPALRDMRFQFVTKGSFKPLTMNIMTGDIAMLPVTTAYLPTTGELLVSDGAIEGITLVDLGSFGITRQYR